MRKESLIYSCTNLPYLFDKTYVFVCQVQLTSLIQQRDIFWHQIEPHLVCVFLQLLHIVTIDNSFVAYFGQNRHIQFQISIFATNVIFQSCLQKLIESFYSQLRLALAIQQTQENQVINLEFQIWILFIGVSISYISIFVL